MSTSRTERLIESQVGLNLAASLAYAAPPRLGYAIAGLAARWISSRRRSEQVRAVRSNQWVVAGESSDPDGLDEAVRGVFQNAARSIYELYHYVHDPEAAGRLFVLEPSVQPIAHRPDFDGRGLVVVGLHLSCFDLALQWICMKWIKPLVLTLPVPQGAQRMEFEIRKKTGMNLLPGTVSGLRQALRHLKSGGLVVTGIDRPVADSPYTPRFFGRPACLPTHHAYLALKAQVPVVLVTSQLGDDGLYYISASPPIEMEPAPGRTDELVHNAERVLASAEAVIRRAPQHWLITQPVWPEVVGIVPA